MEIKSVPPPLAPLIRHMLMATLPRIPPKILISRVSYVMVAAGNTSVSILERKTT